MQIYFNISRSSPGHAWPSPDHWIKMGLKMRHNAIKTKQDPQIPTRSARFEDLKKRGGFPPLSQSISHNY
jgi:hypothetical protein